MTKKVKASSITCIVKIDEWGAVIKNQSEAFKRMEEDQQRKQKVDMQNYGQELESEVFNKLRKNKDSDMEQKRLEYSIALEKKAELDRMNLSNLEKKKQMQSILSADYETAMRQKNQQSQYDRMSDLEKGKMANDKASKELNYLNQSEKDKKNMIKDILNNAKSVHDGTRANQDKDKYMDAFEQQKYIQDLEKRQNDQDMAKVSRYNKFNDFQNKNAQFYNREVINPKMQKDMQFNENIRRQGDEARQKAANDEEMRNMTKKNMAMQARMGQETQMKSKNEGYQATAAEHRYDEFNTRAIERDYNNLKNQDLAEKKHRQSNYKQMLDNQKKTREYMNMYGNMTGIEKQMNRNDLSAFKNYDNKTYALIPGLNSTSHAPSKKVIDDKMNKFNITGKRERSHEEENERMNQFGLTRDVTLMKNPQYYSNNAHKSSMDNITG
jgi:hypothetical protein